MTIKKFALGNVGEATQPLQYMTHVIRKSDFAYAKTKTQISCAVTAQLISAFVIASQIVQSLYLLNPMFQASSHLLWLYSPICVVEDTFSHFAPHIISAHTLDPHFVNQRICLYTEMPEVNI